MGTVKDMSTRYQKYVAKTAPDRVGARYNAVKDIAVARYLQGIARVRPVVDQVKALLDELGVPAGKYAMYISFAEYLAKFTESYSGGTLKNRVLGAVANWVARGADPDILYAVANLVFPGVVGK